MPPSERRRTRFVADAMLGSLARKLRALGFDATYYRSGNDRDLTRLSMREGRIILTSDRSLASGAMTKGAQIILMSGRSDGARVADIVRGTKSLGIPLVRGDPLCSICGGELEILGRSDVPRKVPSTVVQRHRLFFKCISCGQIYWRGSHWKKLRSLARRLREK